MISIYETYRIAASVSGKNPVFHITHITGILDDFFKSYVVSNHIEVSQESLSSGTPS